MTISRRSFIIRSLQLGATMVLPLSCGENSGIEGSMGGAGAGGRGPGSDAEYDHFFLHVVPSYPAGWDGNYLFDARPLEMTRAGLIQNYHGEEPGPWHGRNGTTTLAATLTRPLEPYRDYFSIVNGVHMANIDGHGPNFNFLFTGNALGGASFIPRFNQALPEPFTLDGVQRGPVFAILNNNSGVVPFDVKSARSLLKAAPSRDSVLDEKDPLFSFVEGRFQALGEGTGTFSHASAAMAKAMKSSPSLSRRLERLQIEANAGLDEISFLHLAFDLFRQRVTRAAIIVIDKHEYNFDTHAASNAKLQPRMYTMLISKLAKILATLRETPFDKKRSMLDVTTFLLSSEFGRTMRQEDHPIDDTGTDHNTLANSVMMGGKGIRGGLVLGASDFQSKDEPLSAQHLEVDPTKLRAIGRPFDFANSRPKPFTSDIKAADYLTLGSVMNTYFQLFGVSRDAFWKVEGDGNPAPILGKLLG